MRSIFDQNCVQQQNTSVKALLSSILGVRIEVEGERKVQNLKLIYILL